MARTTLLGLLLLVSFSGLSAKTINPDDFLRAKDSLQAARQYVLRNTQISKHEQARLLLKLGLWDEAGKIIFPAKSPRVNFGKKSDQLEMVKAQYLYLTNDYRAADKIINNILKRDKTNHQAVILKAWLYIQAWKLSAAEGIVNYLAKPNPTDTEALLILCKIKILQKDYSETLRLAEKVQELAPDNAEAYLLESDVYFWNQNPEGHSDL